MDDGFGLMIIKFHAFFKIMYVTNWVFFGCDFCAGCEIEGLGGVIC